MAFLWRSNEGGLSSHAKKGFKGPSWLYSGALQGGRPALGLLPLTKPEAGLPLGTPLQSKWSPLGGSGGPISKHGHLEMDIFSWCGPPLWSKKHESLNVRNSQTQTHWIDPPCMLFIACMFGKCVSNLKKVEHCKNASLFFF